MTNSNALIRTKPMEPRLLRNNNGSKVFGIQASPLCHCTPKTEVIHGTSEWSHLPSYSSLCWNDPALFLLSDLGSFSIKSPLIDLGLHSSSMDQWVFPDLDVKFDVLPGSTVLVTSPRLDSAGKDRDTCTTTETLNLEVYRSRSVRGKDFKLMSDAANRLKKRKRPESHVGGANGLSVEDVRRIFDALKSNHRPPEGLPFQIVEGTKGQKISPPSYEFDDGLFILMKPLKGNSNPSDCIPTKLLDYVLMDTPPSNCPWSISGPQFARPTYVQKRYCYSNGDESYSSKKGATLWTVRGLDGKEDFEYRLLHVYHSMRRGSNKANESRKL